MAKKKIAILGGGVGAMTTAFELTRSPNWQENYEITVYQMGWRIGGKGASGRDLEHGSRILEHGLHIWLGFYENAFELIRIAYDELNRQNLTPGSPFTDFTKAFTKQSTASMMDGDDVWSFWFPQSDEAPGMTVDQQELRTPWDDVLSLLHWLAGRWEEVVHRGMLAIPRTALQDGIRARLHSLLSAVHSELEALSPLHLAVALAEKLPRDGGWHGNGGELLIHLLESARDLIGKALAKAVEHTKYLRRLFILVDASLATVRGMIADGVLLQGYDVINQYDLCEWMRRHGCQSPEVATRAAYDGCFAYQNGDFGKPRIEAGTALRGAMRMMFCYRGAILWRMNAGMGDTIFSPFYLLLKAAGVKFEFFHRVENLGLNAERTAIDSIDFDVQATVKGGGEYSPLVTIKGIPCWPSKPFYDQLDQGEAMQGFELESAWTTWNSGVPKKRLQRGVDFDEVVLGISIGSLPFICKELLDASPRWRAMVDHVGTTQTQAVQMWLHKTATELGYCDNLLLHTNEDFACLSGYVEPFDTYADMGQTLDKETWTEADGVRHIAYFCNVLPDAASIPAPFTDPEFPDREKQRVKDFALHYFRTAMKPIWPNGVDAAGVLDWNVIADYAHQEGEARFDSQFWRCNIDPSERYVLSLPGTTQYRLHPGASGFDNLVLAGDWTYNFINAGCVEAAVISGRLASQSLCGYPKNIKWAFGSELKVERAKGGE